MSVWNKWNRHNIELKWVKNKTRRWMNIETCVHFRFLWYVLYVCILYEHRKQQIMLETGIDIDIIFMDHIRYILHTFTFGTCGVVRVWPWFHPKDRPMPNCCQRFQSLLIVSIHSHQSDFKHPLKSARATSSMNHPRTSSILQPHIT